MSRKLKKVCVCGHFGIGKNLLNGQTIKTKIVTKELERVLNEQEVIKIDTHGGKKKLFTMPILLFRALMSCENIIILPAHNGLCVIAPLLIIENVFFHRNLHYVVIGGWLPEFIEKHKILAWILKKFNCIYVETSKMKQLLENINFKNIVIMPNCKELKILKDSELVYTKKDLFKLCTFSRVMKEKGIEDAVYAVKRVNELANRTIYTLDIYGQIESGQEEWFEKLQKEFPYYIKYCGLVPYDKSVEILKEYFVLLFPTHFYTEGVPGTIIDAYAAGIPVISSMWESFSDVIDNHITGIGYEYRNVTDLINLLMDISLTPQSINEMKVACLKKAENFTPDKIWKVLEIK